jgi:quinol monooxygenase YgiN
MSTISKENNFLTLINVFTVEPQRQNELVELLIKATDGNVNKIKGFISASLHKSLDGTKVTMYAQWKSREDYENMRANASAAPFLEEALKFASFEPGMYTVVETFLPK